MWAYTEMQAPTSISTIIKLGAKGIAYSRLGVYLRPNLYSRIYGKSVSLDI